MVEQAIAKTLRELHNQNALLQQVNVDMEAAQVAHAAQEHVSHVMWWGSRLFAMSEESDGYEAVLIDAGFLTPVLAKQRKVVGEPG